MKQPTMNRFEIAPRLELLFKALCYSSQLDPTFTTAERILINQERGSLLKLIDDRSAEVRKVPARLEDKITRIKHKIDHGKWSPVNEDPFLW